MRRPRTAFTSASAGAIVSAVLSFATPVATAQQLFQAPAPTRSDSASTSTSRSKPDTPTASYTYDAMASARSPRALLRNGIDFIKYKDYIRALRLLRDAEKRQGELDPAERKALAMSIAHAQKMIQEASIKPVPTPADIANANARAAKSDPTTVLAGAMQTAGPESGFKLDSVQLTSATAAGNPPAASPAAERAAANEVELPTPRPPNVNPLPMAPAATPARSPAPVPVLLPSANSAQGAELPPLSAPAASLPMSLPEPSGTLPPPVSPVELPALPNEPNGPSARPEPLPETLKAATTPTPTTAEPTFETKPSDTTPPPLALEPLAEPARNEAKPPALATLPQPARNEAKTPVLAPLAEPVRNEAKPPAATSAVPVPLPAPAAEPETTRVIGLEPLAEPARNEAKTEPGPLPVPAVTPEPGPLSAPAPTPVQAPATPTAEAAPLQGPAPTLLPEPARNEAKTSAAAPAPVPVPVQVPDAEPVAVAPLGSPAPIPSVMSTRGTSPNEPTPPIVPVVEPPPAAEAEAVRPSPVAAPVDAPITAPTTAAPEAVPSQDSRPAPADGSPRESAAVPTLSSEAQQEVARLARRQLQDPKPSTPLPGPSAKPEDVTSNMSIDIPSRFIMPRPPSATEVRPLRRIPVPEEFVPVEKRDWAPIKKYWAAAATCHGPLYFQDATLERYGRSVELLAGTQGRFLTYPLDNPKQSNQRNQILQPFASAGLFVSQIVLLPYNLVVDPPWEAEYDLGYYRPGDRMPAHTFYLPLTGVGPPLRGKNY